MLHKTQKSVALAGPKKAFDWLGIMKSQGEVHTFKEASDQECRDQIVSGRDDDFLAVHTGSSNQGQHMSSKALRCIRSCQFLCCFLHPQLGCFISCKRHVQTLNLQL